ncbi:MAG: MFS transporter [Prevotella sp.]
MAPSDNYQQSQVSSTVAAQFQGNDKLLLGMICGVLGFWLFAQSMLDVNLVMGKSLNLNSSTLNLAVSITAMVSGMFIVIIGRLGDLLGHARILRTGYVISILGMLMIAFVPPTNAAAPILITGRMLLGLSGATIMPTSLALVTMYWHGAAQQRAISIWSMGSWGGGAFASFFGGTISKYFNTEVFDGWRWIFVLGALTALLGLWLLRGLPKRHTQIKEVAVEFDYPGAITLIITLVSLMLIITKGGLWGWFGLTTISFAVVFCLSLFLLIKIERKRGNDALINLSLFKHKKFTGATIVNFCMNSVVGLLIIAMMLMQQAAQFDESSAGLLTLGYGISLVCFIRIGELILRKRGNRFPVLLGLSLVMVAAMLLLPTNIMTGQYMVLVAVSMTFFGLGLALFATPITDAALSDLDETDAGVGSGIFKMASSLGAAIGVAISTGVFTGVSMSGRSSHLLDFFIVWMGRQDNVTIREGAMIAVFFNLVIVILAIFITWRSLPVRKELTKK